MKTDKNGCSTCPAGQEQWEQFYLPRFKKKMYQYEYRHPVTGKLFTTIAPTLALARMRRDLFITEENLRVVRENHKREILVSKQGLEVSIPKQA